MKSTEITNIQYVLKKLLKQQKITILKLAQALEISEATAKRLLTSEDLSMQRIIQICDLLQIQLHDLIELAKNLTSEYYFLPIKQEEFLAKRPLHFETLLQLLRNKPLKTIMGNLKLNRDKLELILLDLADENFLIYKKNEIQLRLRPGLDWRKDGPLWQAFFKPKIQTMISKYHEEKYKDNSSFFDFAVRPLSIKSYRQLKMELDELSKKYGQISKIERHSLAEEQLKEYSCLQIMSLE